MTRLASLAGCVLLTSKEMGTPKYGLRRLRTGKD
jgi:hypothetical protein